MSSPSTTSLKKPKRGHGIATVVTAVLDGDHTTETIGTLASAVIVLITLMGGRYAQAAAKYRDALSPQEKALLAEVAKTALDRSSPPVRPVR